MLNAPCLVTIMRSLSSRPIVIECVTGILILAGLFVTGRYNYLLFHSLAELFSIVVAFGLFLFAWNNQCLLEDNYYYLVLGIGYACVAGFDLLHTLSYKGMGVFAAHDANLPTQLWIVGRYVESLTLLAAPWLAARRKRWPAVSLLAGYGGVFIILVAVIFSTDLFPLCYLEGQGLTAFKIASELVVSGLLAGAIALLWRYRTGFAPRMLYWLIGSIGLSILSEMAFVLYHDVYGIMNLLGHYFKILSFYLIYKAMVETTVRHPYQSLFRKLHASERRFRSYFDLPLIGMAVLSLQGRWLEVNQRFSELLGYDPADFKAHSWATLTERDDWLGWEKSLFERLTQNYQEQYSGEKRFLTKRGESIEMRVSVGCVHDEQGRPAYLVAVADDITAQKNLQRDQDMLIEELRSAAQQIQQLQQLLPICPSCRKVRTPEDEWVSMAEYLRTTLEVDVKYTLCDACFREKFPKAYEAKRTLPQYRSFLAQLQQESEE